ncbi:hypothetical protein L2E82_36108 [Cichorium intybus]|uniref:Uncharacterized protein n=1 Tax=Cichorium intybus TaxID=13427 RepID=A0ACB9BQL9_CICIN|nr:hypothetical protein L2E82_36108 [Cichorium intybus]
MCCCKSSFEYCYSWKHDSKLDQTRKGWVQNSFEVTSQMEQEKGGCRIALKLPHKWHNKIMGFVVCGVFPQNIRSSYACPSITFRIVSDGKVIPRSKVNYMMDATETAKNGWYVWISYMPLGFFQQMYNDLQPEDWSLIKGNLDITVCLGNLTRSLRCGAHVIYKEDIKQIPSCISDYGNVVHVNEEDVGYDETISGNTYVYEAHILLHGQSSYLILLFQEDYS